MKKILIPAFAAAAMVAGAATAAADTHVLPYEPKHHSTTYWESMGSVDRCYPVKHSGEHAYTVRSYSTEEPTALILIAGGDARTTDVTHGVSDGATYAHSSGGPLETVFLCVKDERPATAPDASATPEPEPSETTEPEPEPTTDPEPTETADPEPTPPTTQPEPSNPHATKEPGQGEAPQVPTEEEHAKVVDDHRKASQKVYEDTIRELEKYETRPTSSITEPAPAKPGLPSAGV